MTTILGIITIIFLAVLGANKSFTRLPFLGNVTIFFLTGTEFLIVGVILGPLGVNMLTQEVVRGVSPFVGLGLGWLGLLYGMQFDAKKLIRIPPGYLAGALVQSVISFLVIFTAASLLLRAIPLGVINPYVTALVLAAAGSCSSQTALALFAREARYRRSKTLRMLRFVASIGDFPGLLAFGLILCFLQNEPLISVRAFIPLQWIALTVILGIIFGWLMIFVLRLSLNQEERLLFTIGIVLFSGGIAAYLRISPLFVSFVSGMVIVNFCRKNHELDDIIAVAEKPVYLILLVLAGSMWQIGPAAALGLAVIFFCIRVAGKALGVFVVVQSNLRNRHFPRTAGFGLVNQGGMALAMVINLQAFYADGLFNTAITVIIMAALISELMGLRLTRTILARDSEA